MYPIYLDPLIEMAGASVQYIMFDSGAYIVFNYNERNSYFCSPSPRTCTLSQRLSMMAPGTQHSVLNEY